jgi:glycine betaine/proline transport system substrate-binding protein
MQQLAHYRIEELLGEGTFAWVYRAIDQKLERHVALKVLKPVWLNDPQALARFEREAKTMAQLHHPHIVQVYEVDRAEGQVYLAQFLVVGESLAARLKRGPLAWTETLDILRQVAAALDYAHQRGVIHRDLKPANILLGEGQQAYLGDFGLVGAAEGSANLSASSGGMVGTPGYMAPEQWRGERPSPATDVYALSCVAVEMLTGRVLFDAPTPPAVMTKHILDGPEFPAQWPKDVPAGVTEVLQRGLAKNPGERFSDAGGLVVALSELNSPIPMIETSPPVKPASSPPLVQPLVTLPLAPASEPAAVPTRVSKGLLAGGAVTLVVVGIIIYFVFINVGPPPLPTAYTPTSTITSISKTEESNSNSQEQIKAPEAEEVVPSNDKPSIKLAENPWTGSAVNVAVAKILLEEQLSYPVEIITIDENAQWPALATGDLSASLEVWPSGHSENIKQYIAEQEVVENGGALGVLGKIGWYVPTYVVEEHPELTTWEGFRNPELTILFRMSDTGNEGQFLAGDPSWIQYDESIIRNLNLNLQVVFAGSEQALLARLDSAYSRREPLLFYFWTPHSVHAKYDLSEVKLPEYNEECYNRAVSGGVDCDYPADILFKIFSKDLKDKTPEAYQFLKNFNYTNEDQIEMMAMVELDKKSAQEAAQAWIKKNEAKWKVWLP